MAKKKHRRYYLIDNIEILMILFILLFSLIIFLTPFIMLLLI